MNESPRLVWLLSTPACMGDPEEHLYIGSFFLNIFLIPCSCGKAHLLSKERNSLCLWIAICVFEHSMQKNNTIEIKKKSNLSRSSPMCGWIRPWLGSI